MTPTAKLRWVEKEMIVTELEGVPRTRMGLALQQWWEWEDFDLCGISYGVKGEWRDVQVENEG
jgi:hypothetical protein